jgi:effector-binding domain-containing protein
MDMIRIFQAFAIFLTVLAGVPAHAQSDPAPTPQQPTAPLNPAEPPKPVPDPMEEPSADASNAIEFILQPRPVAYIESNALWDDNFDTMKASIAQVQAEIERLKLKTAGDPLGVYLDTDDNGFRFQLMIPIEAPPPSSITPSPPVKFGTSPVGRSMRFESKGAFDEVDSLYEAISAYLDERQLTMRTPYIEEYQTPLGSSSDPQFRMRIYVILDETKPPPPGADGGQPLQLPGDPAQAPPGAAPSAPIQ